MSVWLWKLFSIFSHFDLNYIKIGKHEKSKYISFWKEKKNNSLLRSVIKF